MADGELFTVFVDASPDLPLPTQPIDEIPVVRSGVTYKAKPSDIAAGGPGSYNGGIGPTVYVSPVSGATITAVIGQGAFGIKPAGPLAVLHLILPPNPLDEQVFEVGTEQDLIMFDAVGSGTDSMSGTCGGPFTLAANGGSSWRYRLSDTSWNPRS